MSTSPPAARRAELRSSALVDGRPADGATSRLWALVQRTLVTAGEREEAGRERRIRSVPNVSRPNVVTVLSPRGGVGKTTGTFVLGTLLATHLKLRAVAVDAAGAFGTLGLLVPAPRRSERTLADLLRDADRLRTTAELRRYVSALPSGLHVLAAPRDPKHAARIPAARYGELTAFLSCFYEVVLLDLGPGLVGPLARLAIERSDQTVLATTPEWLSTPITLDALGELPAERTTVIVNKSLLRPADARAVEQRLCRMHSRRAVTIPHDEQLATMLDSGAYTLEALGGSTRRAIKHLGLAVAEQLV